MADDNELDQPSTDPAPEPSEGLGKLGTILTNRFAIYKKDRAVAEE